MPEGNRNDMCMFFFPEEVNFCRVWEVDRSRYPRYFPSRLTSRQLIENLEIARYCDHTDLPCLVWVDHIVEPFGPPVFSAVWTGCNGAGDASAKQ